MAKWQVLTRLGIWVEVPASTAAVWVVENLGDVRLVTPEEDEA